MENPLADGPVPLGVKAEIGQTMSRATSAGFNAGDVIGVVPVKGGTAQTDGSGIAYTMGADGFAPVSAPYYFTDAQTVTFNAYYPQCTLPEGQTTIALDTRTAQQKAETLGDGLSWRRNDYLAASTTATAFSSTANYTGDHAFRHVMTQLVITFRAGDGVDDLSALTSYTLTTPLVMDGTFTPATGLAVADETKPKETLTMSGLTLESDGSKSSVLILIPQELASDKFPLNVNYNGMTYRANLAAPKAADAGADAAPAFLAGTSYAYEVTINQNGLNVGQAEIKSWQTETHKGDASLIGLGNKTADIAAVGDFYLSDGTLVDGKQKLTPLQQDACIGIVFCVGQHENDDTDYSTTGIGQQKCHGYVLALTDATESNQEKPEVVWGGYKVSLPDVSEDKTDWKGYTNTMALMQFVKTNTQGVTWDNFLSFDLCRKYGTDEGFEWARRFAAPKESTGWFMPSFGQLKYIYHQRDKFKASFDNLEAEAFGDAPVGWFVDQYYWSSTAAGIENAQCMNICTGGDYPRYRFELCLVRLILAF